MHTEEENLFDNKSYRKGLQNFVPDKELKIKICCIGTYGYLPTVNPRDAQFLKEF